MRLGGLQPCSLIDYPGYVTAIVFTIGCNFRCPYCHNPELVEGGVSEIPESEFFTFLKTRQGKLDAVTVTGGEPTEHSDLLEFLSQIKQLGFKVKLDSNGTRPEVIKQAQEQRLVDYLAMDIKAPLFRYESVTARPVDIEAIKESISLLKSGGVTYEFRTTVVKSLLSPIDLEQIGEDIAGAKQYFLQKFVPTKLLNPAFLRKATYTDVEFQQLQKMLSQYVEYCGVR